MAIRWVLLALLVIVASIVLTLAQRGALDWLSPLAMWFVGLALLVGPYIVLIVAIGFLVGIGLRMAGIGRKSKE